MRPLFHRERALILSVEQVPLVRLLHRLGPEAHRCLTLVNSVLALIMLAFRFSVFPVIIVSVIVITLETGIVAGTIIGAVTVTLAILGRKDRQWHEHQ
jgi:hypothetical protein